MNSILGRVLSLLVFLYFAGTVQAATYYSIASGPWTSSSTWSLSSGGSAIGSGYPGAGDDVIIENANEVTIASTQVENLFAANVTIGGASSSGTLSFPANASGGSTITISGDLTLGGSSVSAAGTLYYSSWGLTITCARMLKGVGSATRTNPAQQDFTFTGQFTLPSDPAFVSFRNFIVDNGASVILSQNISTNGSISPKINSGGQLDLKSYTMGITGYKILNIQGTLILGGNTGGFQTSNFPVGYTTLTIGNNSIVKYNYAGNQTIFPTTYNHLIIEGTGSKSVGSEGYIKQLSISNGGSGYRTNSSGCSLTFSGGGGTGAAGTYATSATGTVNRVTLSNAGTGYSSQPTVAASSGSCYQSGVTRATISVQMTYLNSITVNGDLTLGSGSTFSTGSNALTLKGNLINNGTISGTAALLLAGSSAQTMSGIGSITNLTINNSNGVTISSGSHKQSITGTFTPTAGTLITNGNLILKSDAVATARIAQGSGSYISGNVELQRFIATNHRGWRFLTIPVTGATIRDAWAGVPANANANGTNESPGSGTLITGHGFSNGTSAAAAGFDWFSGLTSGSTSSIRFYNNSTWASATNTPNILATPNKEAYMLYIRGDRTIANNSDSSTTTLRPVGALKINTQTIAISNTYEVVGNPYASPIDLDALYNNTGNSAIIERNFWVWDATLGTSGGFRALSSSGGSSYTMTGGSGSASDYLKVQSGQAFFVKMLSPGNITIEESNKIGGTNPIVFGTATPITGSIGLMTVGLNNASNQLDGVAIRYNDGYQSAPTETYDMAKLNNFNENLSVVNGSSYLSIDSRPYPTLKDTVRLSFWNLAPNTYSLQLSSSNLNGRIGTALLIDNFTNSSQSISLTGDTTLYSFAVTANTASSSSNRFSVIFGQQASLPVRFQQISASTKATGISIRWNTTLESELSRYEVEKSADGVVYAKIGALQPSNSAIGGTYEWLDVAPQMGHNFYRIKSVNQNANFNYSSMVKADWSRKAGIELIPTITKDGWVTLVLREQLPGEYQVRLFNLNGSMVSNFTIYHNISSAFYQLKLRVNNIPLVDGIYMMDVSNPFGIRKQFKVVKN